MGRPLSIRDYQQKRDAGKRREIWHEIITLQNVKPELNVFLFLPIVDAFISSKMDFGADYYYLNEEIGHASRLAYFEISSCSNATQLKTWFPLRKVEKHDTGFKSMNRLDSTLHAYYHAWLAPSWFLTRKRLICKE